MASHQVLIQLIANLTKSEKKQLQIKARNENRLESWYWVYSHFLRPPNNFEQLKEDYQKEFPSGSLSSSMNHLYKNIMGLLIQLNTEEDIENKVLQIIQEAKILFSKGIYDECFSQLKKGISLCKKYELNGWLYVVYQLELMLRMSTRYHHFNEMDLLAIQTDISRTLNYLQTQSKHQLQYDLLNRRRSGISQPLDGALNQELDDLALHEQMIFSNQRYSSVKAEKLHLMFQSEYFLAKGNMEISLRIFNNLHELFEKNKHMLGDPPLHYISHIRGILQNLYQMNALQEMNIYLSRLDEMEEEKPGYLNLAGCVSLHYKILQNLKCEKHEDALNYAVKAESLLQQPIYPYSREASILLTISASVAFFRNNEFSRSGKLLRMLDLHEFSLSLLPVFYTAKLMSILIHFEKTDYDVMEAEIRSFLRWVKKYLKNDEREKNVMKLLIHFDSMKNVLIEEHLKNLALQNEKLPASDIMLQSIHLFDWPKWLLKKIQ